MNGPDPKRRRTADVGLEKRVITIRVINLPYPDAPMGGLSIDDVYRCFCICGDIPIISSTTAPKREPPFKTVDVVLEFADAEAASGLTAEWNGHSLTGDGKATLTVLPKSPYKSPEDAVREGSKDLIKTFDPGASALPWKKQPVAKPGRAQDGSKKVIIAHLEGPKKPTVKPLGGLTLDHLFWCFSQVGEVAKVACTPLPKNGTKVEQVDALVQFANTSGADTAVQGWDQMAQQIGVKSVQLDYSVLPQLAVKNDERSWDFSKKGKGKGKGKGKSKEKDEGKGSAEKQKREESHRMPPPPPPAPPAKRARTSPHRNDRHNKNDRREKDDWREKKDWREKNDWRDSQDWRQTDDRKRGFGLSRMATGSRSSRETIPSKSSRDTTGWKTSREMDGARTSRETIGAKKTRETMMSRTSREIVSIAREFQKMGPELGDCIDNLATMMMKTGKANPSESLEASQVAFTAMTTLFQTLREVQQVTSAPTLPGKVELWEPASKAPAPAPPSSVAPPENPAAQSEMPSAFTPMQATPKQPGPSAPTVIQHSMSPFTTSSTPSTQAPPVLKPGVQASAINGADIKVVPLKPAQPSGMKQAKPAGAHPAQPKPSVPAAPGTQGQDAVPTWYSNVMGMLRLKKNEAVKNALNQMKKEGISIQSKDFQEMLRVCQEVNNSQAVEILMNLLGSQFDVEPSKLKDMYEIMISRCKASETAKAEQLIAAMVEKSLEITAKVYDPLIRASAQDGKLDVAEKWLREMLDKNIQPTSHSFGPLVVAAASKNDFDKIDTFIGEMVVYQIAPPASDLEIAIEKCLKANRREAVEGWVQMIQDEGLEPPPSLKCYRLLVKSQIDAGSLLEAQTWLNSMVDVHKGPPSTEIISAHDLLVRAYAAANDGEGTLQTLQQKKDRGLSVPADANLFQFAVRTMINHGNKDAEDQIRAFAKESGVTIP